MAQLHDARLTVTHPLQHTSSAAGDAGGKPEVGTHGQLSQGGATHDVDKALTWHVGPANKHTGESHTQ